MKTLNILLSPNHLCAPFTHIIEEKKVTLPFSTLEKVIVIALSILIGTVSYGIGGVVAFYAITAAMKAWKTRDVPEFQVQQASIHQNAPTPKIREIPFSFFPLPQEEPQSLYPTSIHNRRYPPLSLVDTIINAKGGHCKHNEHFYSDTEILQLHLPRRSLNLGEGNLFNPSIIVDWTDNDKVVIQQQAVRGCTAAVAAMLIYDEGKEINLQSLSTTNLGDTASIQHLIREAGLNPLVTLLKRKGSSEDLLQELRHLLLKNGSAIVSTSNDIGSHVVVVDYISEDLSSIRLRDPFHGWEITVTQAGFLRGFGGGDIIQIAH